jgi:hypothetical protein
MRRRLVLGVMLLCSVTAADPRRTRRPAGDPLTIVSRPLADGDRRVVTVTRHHLRDDGSPEQTRRYEIAVRVSRVRDQREYAAYLDVVYAEITTTSPAGVIETRKPLHGAYLRIAEPQYTGIDGFCYTMTEDTILHPTVLEAPITPDEAAALRDFKREEAEVERAMVLVRDHPLRAGESVTVFGIATLRRERDRDGAAHYVIESTGRDRVVTLKVDPSHGRPLWYRLAVKPMTTTLEVAYRYD